MAEHSAATNQTTEEERQELLRQEDRDLREFCEFVNAPYIWLKSFIRHSIGGTPGLEKSDVVYAIGMAKQNGLPVTGDWYTPIPRQGGQGFSLCFRLDAAYYILTHDDRLVKGSIDWWYTSGKGERITKDNPPRYGNIHEIDFNLCCTVSARLAGVEEPLQFTCRYADWVSGTWKDGKFSPKPLWLKMAAHMLFKQTVKEWTRVYLGACLEYEDALPGAFEQQALPAPEPESPLSDEQEKRVTYIADLTGHPISKVRAAAIDFMASGGDFDSFAAKWSGTGPNSTPRIQRVQALQQEDAPEASSPANHPPAVPAIEYGGIPDDSQGDDYEDTPQEGPEPPEPEPEPQPEPVEEPDPQKSAETAAPKKSPPRRPRTTRKPPATPEVTVPETKSQPKDLPLF
jgi:hypothetical protein